MTSSIDYSHLNWTQTAPHRWERGVDEPEEFYHCIAKQWAGSGRMFFAMTGFASIYVDVKDGSDTVQTGERLEAALRQAWLSIRYDHPTIASWVEYDVSNDRFRKVYESFRSESDREAWLASTFKTIETTFSGSDWANNDPPAPQLPTLFVISQSGVVGSHQKNVRRDIVFRSPHEIVDGIGTLQLLGNLFRKTTEAYDHSSTNTTPTFGDEHHNLSPPFRIAAEIPLSMSSTDIKRLEDIFAENERLKSTASLCTLPFARGAVTPCVHKRTYLTLSEAQTTLLLAKCKSASLTPTHAYHAGIALALRNLQPLDPPRDVRYLSYSLINHRRDCKPPYNTSQHPVSVIHSASGRSLALDMSVPPPNSNTSGTSEFGTIVSKVEAFYRSIASDKTHLACAPTSWARKTPSLPAEALLTDGPAPPVPDPDLTPSVSISSMGRLDDIIAHQYGGLRIEDPWITGEELRSGLGVFLGTWRGKLTLSAAYNDAWHNEAEVLGFLKRCNTIVHHGLGLNIGT